MTFEVFRQFKLIGRKCKFQASSDSAFHSKLLFNFLFKMQLVSRGHTTAINQESKSHHLMSGEAIRSSDWIGFGKCGELVRFRWVFLRRLVTGQTRSPRRPERGSA